MKTVLCFGNPDIKEDSLALELANELVIEGYTFIKCTRAELLLEYKNKNIIILDVVKNLKDVREVSVENIAAEKLFTTHDFDLGHFLKLMKALKLVKNVRIIGIPQSGDREKIKDEVKRLLNEIKKYI